jgi:outer membrane murein-binding lipoprotein Lpp
MSSNFRYYRQAAQSLSSGWLQLGWQNSNENCLVQVLRDVIGCYRLPSDVIAELDGELDRFKDYRLARVVFRMRDQYVSLEGLFVLWNDSPWRRKRDVVGVLNALADRLEMEWEKAERIRIAAEREEEIARVTAQRDRLNAKIEELRPQVEQLEARVKELEEENGVLRRLTNGITLRADRRNLQQLSDELDSRYKEIETLPETVTVA